MSPKQARLKADELHRHLAVGAVVYVIFNSKRIGRIIRRGQEEAHVRMLYDEVGPVNQPQPGAFRSYDEWYRFDEIELYEEEKTPV